MSNFNYCPTIWMFTGNVQLKKLARLQERALRFVLKDYESDFHTLLSKSKVPSITLMTLRNLAIEIYKCINDKSPQYLKSLFNYKESCPYNLRGSKLLEIPKVKTTSYGLKSFTFYGSKIWNILPENCRTSISVDDFKHIIQSWYGPNCQCSLCCLYKK